MLDSHLPKRLAAAVHALTPDCYVAHLSTWRDGAFGDAGDDVIILAAAEEDLAFVRYDINTIPATVSELIASRREFTGVILFSARAGPDDVGSLARPLAHLFSDPSALDPAYPVMFRRPGTVGAE